MQFTQVGSRGRVVSFPELGTTHIYLVFGPRHTFICDTFLGPAAMEGVLEYLAAEGRAQPAIVFNSHKDWDHVWGNCAFPEVPIIATGWCRQTMAESFVSELDHYHEYARGEVTLALPNLTFSRSLHFEDDQVTFFPLRVTRGDRQVAGITWTAPFSPVTMWNTPSPISFPLIWEHTGRAWNSSWT